MKSDISKIGFFHISLDRIFLRKFHHHTSGRSDDLPSQKYVLQSERLNLLPVFRFRNKLRCFPPFVIFDERNGWCRNLKGDRWIFFPLDQMLATG